MFCAQFLMVTALAIRERLLGYCLREIVGRRPLLGISANHAAAYIPTPQNLCNETLRKRERFSDCTEADCGI